MGEMQAPPVPKSNLKDMNVYEMSVEGTVTVRAKNPEEAVDIVRGGFKVKNERPWLEENLNIRRKI